MDVASLLLFVRVVLLIQHIITVPVVEHALEHIKKNEKSSWKRFENRSKNIRNMKKVLKIQNTSTTN